MRPANADNELSAFYHSSNRRATLEAAAATAGSIDLKAMLRMRVTQYREEVAAGWERQEALGAPKISVTATQASLSGPTATVWADVERWGTPLPPAVLAHFQKMKAEQVDEAKYVRMRTMA
jgi:hypothetical protein